MNEQETIWFIEPDAYGEPTLWLRRPGWPESPVAVLRRCDMATGTRHLWPLVPQATP